MNVNRLEECLAHNKQSTNAAFSDSLSGCSGFFLCAFIIFCIHGGEFISVHLSQEVLKRKSNNLLNIVSLV